MVFHSVADSRDTR